MPDDTTLQSGNDPTNDQSANRSGQLAYGASTKPSLDTIMPAGQNTPSVSSIPAESRASLDSIFSSSPASQSQDNGPSLDATAKLDAIFKGGGGIVPSNSNSFSDLVGPEARDKAMADENNPVAQIIKGVGEDYANAIPNFLKAVNPQIPEPSETPGSLQESVNNSTPVGNPGTFMKNVGEGALGGTASILNTIFSPITRTVSTLADALSNNKSVQQMLSGNGPDAGPMNGFKQILDLVGQAHNAINDWQQKNPEVAKNLNNALTIGTTALGAEAEPTINESASNALDKAGNALTPEAEVAPEPSLASAFEPGGATHNLITTYDNAIQSGDASPESVYSDPEAKVFTPDRAQQIIENTKAQFDRAGRPDLGSKFESMVDPKNLTADQVLNAGKELTTAPETSAPTSATAKPSSDALAVQLKGVADDWESPTKQNAPAFNNARDVLAKTPETPQFLAEQGLNPFKHIDENNKYATSDTADALRNTAGKMSSDTLRPSLQLADYTTPKTNVEALSTPALADAKSEYGVTAGNGKVIEQNIASELAALKENYPNGMSLENMHDEKITYAKNGGYSPVKDPAVTNKAIANRAISTALGNMVEKNAPADVPVHDFNDYLSNYYKAADYLDSLNGKKVPVSGIKNAARMAAKFVGAKLGGMFGGDLVSSFAGYQIGKALEHAIENITNPMRDAFLNNLKKTNPEAYSKVADFIGKTNAEAATRLKLPAGAPIGTEKNPMVTPPPKPPESTVRSVPAERISIKNPGTGKFERAYTSGERKIKK